MGGAVRTPTFEHVGPGLLENAGDACGPDLPTSIAAMLRFLRAIGREVVGHDVAAVGPADQHRPVELQRPLSDHDCWNMVAPTELRGALFAREIDASELLSRLSVPVLVTHGLADAIVLPAMAEQVLEVCPTARASWYENVGHMPFVEDSGRFDLELAELVRQVA